jgi:hypothetical protein
MAAHRAAKPAPDPLAAAQSLIEQRLAAGDPAVRQWLQELRPSGAPAALLERFDPATPEFDYNRLADPLWRSAPGQSFRSLTAALMSSKGEFVIACARAVVELLKHGVRLREIRQHLEPELYRDWVIQACRMTESQADALIRATNAAPDVVGDPFWDPQHEPWQLFELLEELAPAGSDSGGGAVVDVEPLTARLAGVA